MPNPIKAKIESARKELLDLGLRNPLINYRSRTRRIDIVDELATEVFRILVTDNKSMTFKARPGETVDPETSGLFEMLSGGDRQWESVFTEEATTNADSGAMADRHLDRVLQTKLDAKTLHARLLNIYRDARTILEEQGVNILYLVIGFLHWYESQEDDRERVAPLLLVPVELERAGVTERFKLKYSGDEIGDNLSLTEKLRAEFSISLPPIAEFEELDVGDYLRGVEERIGGQQRWRVAHNELVIGFFSFGKFLMYKDLAPDSWPDNSQPEAHSILSSLLGDGFREPPLVDGDDVKVDDLVAPGDLHQVLDADSSQTLAILDVNAGRNMVIQGPPGTGKSQTIANIIAEAIGKGKTTLFVSEKMAALEVVKRRLDVVGIGDAVLELHSHKTRKREVLDELARTLNARKPVVRDAADELQTLTSLRDRLNSYCQAVNTPVLRSGVWPAAAVGRLRELGALPAAMPRMDFSVMKEWSQGAYLEQRARIEELQRRVGTIGVPAESPFWGVKLRVLLPSDHKDLQLRVQNLVANTKAIHAKSRHLAEMLSLDASVTYGGVIRLIRAVERILDAPDLSGLRLAESDWQTKREQLGTLLRTGRELTELKSSLSDLLIDEAWDQDLLKEREHFVAYGKKWWRFLSAKYRSAKSRLRGLMRKEVPRTQDECIALVDGVLSARRMQKVYDEFEDLGGRLFGERWRGRTSDWAALASLALWVANLHGDIAGGHLPAEMFGALRQPVAKNDIRELHTELSESARAQLLAITELEGRLAFQPAGDLLSRPIPALAVLLDNWLSHWSALQPYSSFNAFAAELVAQGLQAAVTLAESWKDAASDLVKVFDATWYEGLLECAYRERPMLAQFDRTSHEHAVERFCALDKATFNLNCARVAKTHWTNLPAAGHGGEVGTIYAEINKKRRHLAIRQLVKQAGRALQAIKPVFMMSPQSIAMFLPPGSVQFDIVVFDEASQVKPVDAFGAMLRGRQVVVVGDSKQLPPTTFFESLLDDEPPNDEEESANVAQDVESVLSLFLAKGAPQRMLRWHYRSQHESLISVSNHEFYDDRLVVFPSPDYGRETLGLRFHQLNDAYYDRGRSRTSPEEARIVASRVMQYAKTHPNLTMGVAAFSTPQRDAILFHLELLRRQDTSAEPFFLSHPEEPFFVKNLENVQGDERDIILISVGYGKTQEGYLAMNFGPLNQSGGERRLNVLITRARKICDVFANFTADDLDLRRTQARGVSALKTFLKYAEEGHLDVPRPTGSDPESPFEESVLEALRVAGYEIHAQVGAGGFRVDLGVVDSDKPGRYLLGIECDGATYHSAQSARDRDRIRQEVLENLGWRIHRIWSTDWFREPVAETRRAAEAIERARAYWAGKGSPTSTHAKKASSATIEIARSAESALEKPTPKAIAYQVSDISIRLGRRELHELSVGEMAEHIQKIIDAEAPIHFEQVIARVTAGASVQRAGNRIRELIIASVDDLCRRKSATRRRDFLYKPGGRVVPRDRSELTQQERRLEYVAPEEILTAVAVIVRGAFRIPLDDAINDACRMVGFRRVTSAMDDLVRALVRKHAAAMNIQSVGDELVWQTSS